MIRNPLKAVLSTFRNIKKVISYIPIIWNNYDWDFSFLYIIERKKLNDMIKCMTEDEISTSDWRSVRYMKICVSLLDEMIGDVDRSNNYLNIRNWRNTNSRFGKDTRDAREDLYKKKNEPDIKLDIRNSDGSESEIFKDHYLNRLEMFRDVIRKEKVYRLYFKIRYYFTDNWWN